jgi:hypothetical protein
MPPSTPAPKRRMAAYKLPPDLLDEVGRLSRLPGEPSMTAIVEDGFRRYVRAARKRHQSATEGA